MTPAVHRAGIAGMSVTSDRQAIPPITWTDYGYAPGDPQYKIENLVSQNGVYFTSAAIAPFQASPQLLGTIDWGSVKYVEDAAFIGCQAYDYFGSGATVGCQLSLRDDAGIIPGATHIGTGSNSSAALPIRRASRYLHIYGKQTGGYGSDPLGNYTTIVYIDYLPVTAER